MLFVFPDRRDVFQTLSFLLALRFDRTCFDRTLRPLSALTDLRRFMIVQNEQPPHRRSREKVFSTLLAPPYLTNIRFKKLFRALPYCLLIHAFYFYIEFFRTLCPLFLPTFLKLFDALETQRSILNYVLRQKRILNSMNGSGRETFTFLEHCEIKQRNFRSIPISLFSTTLR